MVLKLLRFFLYGSVSGIRVTTIAVTLLMVLTFVFMLQWWVNRAYGHSDEPNGTRSASWHILRLSNLIFILGVGFAICGLGQDLPFRFWTLERVSGVIFSLAYLVRRCE